MPNSLLKESTLSSAVQLKELTIGTIQEFVHDHCAMIVLNPGGELFQGSMKAYLPEDAEEFEHTGGPKGILIDVQRLNVIKTVHAHLAKTKGEKEVEEKFNNILQDEYKFANLLDKMWGWVK